MAGPARLACALLVVAGTAVFGTPDGDYARAIREVAGGGVYFGARVATVALSGNGRKPVVLSRREAEVLRLAASGLTSVAIGARLGISSKTVDTHVERACRKLGVSNRTAAVGRAIELGMITTRPQKAGNSNE